MQGQREADIQQAIGQAVVKYRDQLNSAQANLQQRDREHQQSVQKLQDQIRALELSLAGQVTLPSVAASSSKTGLCQEVFNVLPSTVNQCRGAAQYKSQDQAFSFQKQVRFEDNTSSPELGSNLNSGEGRPALSLPVIPPRLSDISGILHTPHHSSTPYRTIPKDHTFDIEPTAPLIDESRHVATIVAEVSAAAAAQASKEFRGCKSLRLPSSEVDIPPTCRVDV